MTAALIGGGIDRVWIDRIDRDISEAGVLTNVQNFLPALPAVAGLVESAISAGRPQRPLGSDEHRVAVFRMNRDPADVLRMLQTNVRPALTSVFRFVDTVAVVDA